MQADLEHLTNEIKDYVATQDKLLEGRLKMWIMGAIILQVIPLMTIAFFIGGIYQNLNSSLALVLKQGKELETRGKWMGERERWELAVEIWGARMKPPLQLPVKQMEPEVEVDKKD